MRLERGESFFPNVHGTYALLLIKEVMERTAEDELMPVNSEMWYSVEAEDPMDAIRQFVHEMHEALSGELFQGISYKILEFKGVFEVEHKFAGHKLIVDESGKYYRPYYKVYYTKIL